MSEERQQEEQTATQEVQEEAPAVEETVVEEQPQQPPPQEPAPDWRMREITRLREQNRRLREQVAAAPQQPAPPQNPATPQANEEFQRLVREEAARQAQVLSQQNEFARQCNEAAEAGRRSYSDFDQRVNALKGLIDFNDQQQSVAYNSFLTAVIETGDAPRLIHELGGNPNEAARVLALPPVKMAVELAKMATPSDNGQQQSNTPRPITPVTRGNSNRNPIDPADPERSDQLSTAEWMRRRQEQDAAARNARFGR